MPLKNLRKMWSSHKASASEIDGDCENVDTEQTASRNAVPQLPLLQVWPSQDSPPKTDTGSQHFVFNCEDGTNVHQHDSGIDSVQASPSPRPSQCYQADELSPTPSNKSRRTSTSSFLHPNHARFLRSGPSEQITVEEFDFANGSCSSSTASSMTSIPGGPQLSARHSDPWDRRRSSVTRCSLFDTLDLEYALLRAATRSSFGHRSLSQSFHKLTFTQSLAFPALAKGLASHKRRPSRRPPSRSDSSESGLNALAKIITVVILVAVSLLVFGVVFKYVRT